MSKMKETPKKGTAGKKKEVPKKGTAGKKKETPKKETAGKKKETPKKATVSKKNEKVGAKSVSAKTSKLNPKVSAQKPQTVKTFCNITFDDVKGSDSEIDTGIILSLSGEPKKAVISLDGEYSEVTWWGEGGDPAKNGQIDTGRAAMGVLQIKTTTYSEIGEHFVSLEAVSKGTMYRKSVKFTVVS
jgi:hypothetical protein